MSADGCYFFCDAATQSRLAEPGRRVLLLGSCGGFANFGDVLQLKGAIDWHRSTTGLEPVLIMHTTAIPNAEFTERLRGWYGVADILYWAPRPYDLSSVQMGLLGGHAPIAYLHVYGGGFLNRYWGAGSLAIIEGLIERFGAGHYVLSGQQVDDQFVPELREHFARHRPLLAGGRDPRSAELLGDCGVDAADSFDDAIERIDALAASASAADGPTADALIHLNTSYYADQPDRGGLASIARDLSTLAAHLAEAAAREPEILLAQAYTDRRSDEIFDTMGVVLQLEDAFPFRRYQVADLARVALEMGTPLDRGGPPLRARVGLSSSYHIAILCSSMRVPCHFLAHNDYYAQKRAGLPGCDAGSGELLGFLASPRLLNLNGRRGVRIEWLRRLTEKYSVSARPLVAAGAPPAQAAIPWRPKASLRPPPQPEVRREVSAESTMTQLRPSEQQVLRALVRGLRPRVALEIGSAEGGSALLIGAAMDEAGEGRIICVDPEFRFAEETRRRLEGRATLISGKSPEALTTVREILGRETIDFAFVDGDHTYSGALADLEALLPLLSPGAVVLLHDSHYPPVKAAIHAVLAAHPDRLTDLGELSTEQSPVETPQGIETWAGLRGIRYHPGLRGAADARNEAAETALSEDAARELSAEVLRVRGESRALAAGFDERGRRVIELETELRRVIDALHEAQQESQSRARRINELEARRT